MNTRQPRTVCLTCNIGWMSRLDEASKDILIPLLLGQPTTLTPEAQGRIAAWIAMKCMVVESLNPQDMVSSEEERRSVMTQATCPPNWTIRIANNLSDRLRTGIIRNSMTLGLVPKGLAPITPDGTFAKNTQSITIGFGKLLVYAVSTRIPGADINLAPNVAALTKLIWPVQHDLVWPPVLGIRAATIDALGVALHKFARRLPRKPAR